MATVKGKKAVGKPTPGFEAHRPLVPTVVRRRDSLIGFTGKGTVTGSNP